MTISRPGLRLSSGLSLLGFTIALAGCATHIKPELSSLIPSPPVPSPPPSVVTTNIRVSLAGLGPALNDSVPDTFSSDDYCALLGLACVHGTLIREPFRLHISGNHVILQSLIHYEVDGDFLVISGSCGHPDNTKRRASVKYEADVTLLPTWKVNVSGGKTEVTPFNGYTCKVTVATIDVTSKVMDVMNHVASGVTDRAKQQILSESSKLHDLANEAWNTIATPIPLGSFGYAEMRPESVSLGRLAIANETLSATLSISAKPLFMLGTPPATTPLQVPDFQPGGAVSDQFSIMALVRLPFQTLED